MPTLVRLWLFYLQLQHARDLKVAEKKAKEAAHDATKDAVDAANKRARDALILAY